MGLTNNNKFLLAFAGQRGPSAEINRQLCRAVLWTRCFRNMRRLYYLPMAGPGAKEPRFPVIVDSEHRYEKWSSPASQPAVCLVWRSHIPAINYYLIITIHIVWHSGPHRMGISIFSDLCRQVVWFGLRAKSYGLVKCYGPMSCPMFEPLGGIRTYAWSSGDAEH